MIALENPLRDAGLAVGVVTAHGVSTGDSPPELLSELAELVARRRADDVPQARKDAVRALLRTGGFRPSGRSKPASEYLSQAAREERFPFINNLVDVNNFVSLLSGLPVSLLDLGRFDGALRLRYGREGERYVFNAAGHDIDLAGLICACNGATDAPLGNPVKDSMAGKITAATTAVVGVVYAPAAALASGELEELTGRFARMLAAFGGAAATAATVG